MLADQYIAKNEYELYGELLKDLTESDILQDGCRVYCYATSNETSRWELKETFQTGFDHECADFFVARQGTNFMIVFGPLGVEVTFFGKELCILTEYKEKRLQILDFEDLKPGQAYLDFQKKELRQSAEFLRKILK